MKRGRGRPPKGNEALTERLQVRVTKDERREIESYATDDGGVSVWGRELMLQEIRRRPRQKLK